MSIEAARAFMHRVKRGVQVATLDWYRACACNYYDGETVLGVVASYGKLAGYEFTDDEYRIAATQEVEALLGSGQLADQGKLIVFFHDLVEGGGDFLVFRRGAREENNRHSSLISTQLSRDSACPLSRLGLCLTTPD